MPTNERTDEQIKDLKCMRTNWQTDVQMDILSENMKDRQHYRVSPLKKLKYSKKYKIMSAKSIGLR